MKVCHWNQEIRIWEPNFWNLAARAIEGDVEPFRSRLAESHPFLDVPRSPTKDDIFDLWDQSLARLGPVLFDKSPQYLGNRSALNLIRQYRDGGRDVRFFAVIRNPEDVIASQYEVLGRGSRRHAIERWRRLVQEFRHLEDDSLERRETHWLAKNDHLFELITKGENIPIFRYEDLAAAPHVYMPHIFHHCGVEHVPESYADFHPTNVGRRRRSTDREVRNWRPGARLAKAMAFYGYSTAISGPHGLGRFAQCFRR